MSVAEGENEDGAHIQLSDWGNRPNQRWLLTCLGDGAYRFEATGTTDFGKDSIEMDWQKVLSVENASTRTGSSLVQSTWNDGEGEEQLWKIRKNKDGTYRIENVYSGKVASVQDGSSYAGAKVIQAEWNNSDSQKWNIKMPNSN